MWRFGCNVSFLLSQVITTNYYFDSVNGDDANNGTSVRTPF